MIKRISISIFLLIISFCTYAQNVGGYGKSEWGMSPSQVVSAEGGRASILSKPETFKNAQGIVGVDSVEISGREFSVIYLFDNNKLIQVNVSSHEKKNVLINKDSFNSAESLLTQKYGNPSYRDIGKNSVWKLNGTTIELTHLFIQDVMTRVVISYKPSSVTDRDTKNL